MSTRSTLNPTHRRERAELDDEFLRRELLARSTNPEAPSTTGWEAVGAYLLVLAERHSRQWPTDPGEFQDGFITAAYEAMDRIPTEIAGSRHPWGLLVTIGRAAGQVAVGSTATGGLVDRDPHTHHIRYSALPAVARYGRLAEIDLPFARRIA